MKPLLMTCLLFVLTSTIISMEQHEPTLLEHYEIPTEIADLIIQRNEENVRYYFLSRSDYGYSFSDPAIFSYYSKQKYEYLHEPTTLNSLEVIKFTYNNDSRNLQGTDLLASSYDQDTLFRLQVWNNYYDKIRLDDDMENINHAFNVIETPLNKACIMFDGANDKGFCAIGIMSPNHFRILIIDKNNPVSDKKTGNRANHTKKSSAKMKYEKATLNALMLHYHKNRLALCTHNSNTNQYYFMIQDIIEKYDPINECPFTITNVQEPVAIPFGLQHIARLTDWTYLALTDSGTVVSIALKDNNETDFNCKKIIYRRSGEADLVDTFTHLAIDNCTDSYGQNSPERVATDFALINKEGMLFWGSFHKHFYNDKGQITLRKVNNENYSQAEKIWLNNDEIGILVKYPQVKKVVKHKVHFFELPAIEDKKSQNK